MKRTPSPSPEGGPGGVRFVTAPKAATTPPGSAATKKNINNRIAALKRMKRTPSLTPEGGPGGVRLLKRRRRRRQHRPEAQRRRKNIKLKIEVMVILVFKLRLLFDQISGDRHGGRVEQTCSQKGIVERIGLPEGDLTHKPVGKGAVRASPADSPTTRPASSSCSTPSPTPPTA